MTLAERMRGDYEQATRMILPAQAWSVLRLDGKGFRSYTRDLNRPFDKRLLEDLVAVATFLCERVQGARLAYQQSDEISLILTDRGTDTTQAWFGGNVQKTVSVAASMATAKFNTLRPGKLAYFDARVFTLPTPDEVAGYLSWRQRDAVRNSVAMTARAYYPHRVLHRKTTTDLRAMLLADHQVSWAEMDTRFTHGCLVRPVTHRAPVTWTHQRTGTVHTTLDVQRRVWQASAAPVFHHHTPDVTTWITPGSRDA